MMRSNPLLIEQIYQTGFPGLDSNRDKFNGLYRLKANKVLLIEPEVVSNWIADNQELLNKSIQVRSFKIKNKEGKEIQSEQKSLSIDRKKVLKELSQKGQILDLGQEVGVGDLDHFDELKKVANAEMARAVQERERQAELNREQEKQAKIEAEKERRAGLNLFQRMLEDIFGR